MAISHFYHNVKLRHAVAPHVLQSVFLNWHSIITNSIICFQISYIESKKNRQNSGSLNMPFGMFVMSYKCCLQAFLTVLV